MIKNKLLLLFTILSALALGACGSSSGGGGGGGGGGGLATGGFTKTVILDGGNSNWGYPFDSTFGPESRFQILYRASDINGSGIITSISFQREFDNPIAISCPNISVRMGHTSLTDLTATYAGNIEQGKGSFEIVLNNKTISAAIGVAGDYFDINLDTPFNYNGVDNIVVEIERPVLCDSTGLSIDTTIGSTPYVAVINSTTLAAATGTPNNYPPHIKFNFTGGDNAVVYGGASWLSVPLTTISSLQKSQFLYPAAQINGSGPITGIAFPIGNPTTAEDYTVTVRLGHSTLTDLGTTFAANFSDAPVTVANTVNLEVPAGMPVGSDLWIPLPDGVFNYNGVDNLIVEIDVSSTTGDTYWVLDSIPGGNMTRLYGASGAAVGGGVNAVVNDIKLRFNGGTMDVITAATGGGGDNFPFAWTDGTRQYLFLAAELGTAGQLTKVGCRNWSTDAVAQTGLNYTITMSHTAATTLVTDRVTNLPTPVVVYSGTFDQPALLGGDWFDIQLSTPFTYNGTDNLVVEFSGTGGVDATGVYCRMDSSSSTLYASRRTGGSSGATSLFTSDTLIDMRFTLQ